VQFLFRLPGGERYIHCGDMRFCPGLLGNEHLQRFVGAQAVFLDTTYCKLKHQFPPQARACMHNACAN
jgi:DNA ligase-1